MRSLWRYNKITGLWVHVRTVSVATEDRWLQIWQRDEPDTHFVVAKNRPRMAPTT
jgi:hypothetical protein